MSCDDNHEARAKDRVRRSLPIVKSESQGAPASSSASRKLWRSIEERTRAETPGAANEFPGGAADLDGVSRRGFMQLLGVSTAVATVGAACRKPNEKIIPFVRRPEELTPGNALHFATGYALEGYTSGLLVESHEGHPTKIEGNPSHPETLGATTTTEQALILGLYDDDRAKQLRRGATPIAWPTFLSEVKGRTASLAQNGGAGLRFLTGPTASPLLADLRRRILEKFPRAKFVSYSPVAADGAIEGAKLAFGRPLMPRHHLGAAAIILSLDADFLNDGPEQTRLAREFASRREPSRDMNRLYVVEPAMTVTGAMADHRMRLRCGDVSAFAAGLCAMLSGRGLSALGPVGSLGHGAGLWDSKWLVALAADLEKNRGRSLVIAGRRQPAVVHALAAALNAALGNIGSTVEYGVPITTDPTAGVEPLRTLVDEIAGGAVDTLVVTAENPAYGGPVDFKLGQLLKRVPNVIYHGLYEDETAQSCNYFVPAAHALESWGDGRATDGVVTIVQPLIAPLWGGKTEAEVLAAFVSDGEVGTHALLQKYWSSMSKLPGNLTGSFDGVWERWLADGIVPDTGAGAEQGLAINSQALAQAAAPLLASDAALAGVEIAFAPDPKTFDGRFANNAWLQELAHPISKLTWDNVAMLSQTTADRLSVETGDMVTITCRDRTLEAPAMIVPGHADEAITLPLGYGRVHTGHVGRAVGFDATALRTSLAPWFDRGAVVANTGKRYRLAITQDHWTMSPDGRDIPPPAVEAPLAEVLNSGSMFHEELEERRGPLPDVFKPVDYSGQTYKWAMAIDLNKCTGCNACVVACQSENNIPVVGKDNVWRGREMQWIRIDRYFSGPVDEPQMINQPLACVQCETAPCEYVCPVNATVHSDEGLNEMIYNRCIGTRYCSNNCPYKVRRFNFLDYTADISPAREMGMNPDVTVRARGVMEKCTYCVQRIERKRIATRIEGRTIADGELETACQQGCPTQAISFGSLNDPTAKVTKLHADPRRYDLLHELATRPRTAYLARVRNPNPDLVKVD
ncbi:MAG TPA: TAT-variant-translocated molybdopterin oxidoreductase [Polyangia bacterium]|jgi:molybdopterin-containing oxidoreductase family iron-sulfur binding subunit|nr:TAT-variant-translocated molybdopterin oxidoreductase [Polyangia bacterium]